MEHLHDIIRSQIFWQIEPYCTVFGPQSNIALATTLNHEELINKADYCLFAHALTFENSFDKDNFTRNLTATSRRLVQSPGGLNASSLIVENRNFVRKNYSLEPNWPQKKIGLTKGNYWIGSESMDPRTPSKILNPHSDWFRQSTDISTRLKTRRD